MIKKLYKPILILAYMQNIFKKIFSENIDENVHNDFIKFGRGEFKNKYLIEAKRQKDKWSIKTSAEFSNYLVMKCLEDASPEEKIYVKGIIICTFDLSKEIDFEIENIKKYMGIQQYKINTNIEAGKIIKLMEKYPRFHYGLSFKTKNCELKIKEKTPKGAKPSAKSENGLKTDFCSLKTSRKDIIDDLFFDFPDFDFISVNHTIKIDEVILSNGIKDPVQLREMAKKKGKIIREISIDGRKERSEKEFVA